jgi:hypothetical protein
MLSCIKQEENQHVLDKRVINGSTIDFILEKEKKLYSSKIKNIIGFYSNLFKNSYNNTRIGNTHDSKIQRTVLKAIN